MTAPSFASRSRNAVRAAASANRSGRKRTTSASGASGGKPNIILRWGLAASVVRRRRQEHAERADEDAFVHGLEKRAKRRRVAARNLSRTSRHAGQIIGGSPSAAELKACGVGVDDGKAAGTSSRSPARMALTAVPGLNSSHRVAAHVQADRAADSVRLPFGDAPIGRASLHEAVVVAVVAEALAAAVAGNVLQDLRVPRGELVDLLDDGHRPRWGVRNGRQRG